MTRTIEECIDIIENALFEEGRPEIYSVYDQEKDEAWNLVKDSLNVFDQLTNKLVSVGRTMHKETNVERIGYNEEPIESINEYWEHNEDLILEKLMDYVLGEDKWMTLIGRKP